MTQLLIFAIYTEKAQELLQTATCAKMSNFID